MATKPTQVPRWEPDPSDITEPSEGQKDSGWQPNEAPAAQIFNWFWSSVSKWVSYLDGLTSTALTWTAKQTFSAGADVTGGTTTDTLDVSGGATVDALEVSNDLDVSGDASVGGDLTVDNINALGGISAEELHVAGAPSHPARKWGLVRIGDSGPGTNTTVAGSEAYTVGTADAVSYRVTFATPMPSANYAVTIKADVYGVTSYIATAMKARHANYFEFYAADMKTGETFSIPNHFPPASVELLVSFAVYQ